MTIALGTPVAWEWTAIAVVILMLVVLCWLACLPGSIARRRQHPNATAISICGLIGFFFTGGLLWLVALVWAFTAAPKPAQVVRVQRYAAPIQWDVIGTDRGSGFQTKLRVQARDVDEAKYLAAEQGVVVEGVRRAGA